MKIVKREKREKKIVRLKSIREMQRESRKHGPVKIYTPDELIIFNIQRGLI